MIGTMEAPKMSDLASIDRSTPGAGTWVEVLPHIHPKFGGMSAVVPQLANQLAERTRNRIEIAAFCPHDENAAATNCDDLPLTNWPASRLPWLLEKSLRARFRRMLQDADGVHIHGLWETSTSVAARTARKLGKPYILSAHGMLEPWALANKRLKKMVYSALQERSTVQHAACLHALTHAEAEDYRRFGCRQPIAVIPNGVDVPSNADAELFLDRYPTLRGKRIVLFLGRVHFKKGIALLIDAWTTLTAEFPDAALVIAGPDDEGTRAALDRKIEQAGLGKAVVFTGMLEGAVKWSALAAAHCFVLPSYSEGLSVAALEALALGVPVVLTTHCHLPEVAERKAGFVVAAELTELSAALEIMLDLTPAAREEMSVQARKLVQERFSWPVVARQMAELYGWVLGSPRPEGVPLLEVIA